MYKLFADESGLKNPEQEKVCIVGGFVATAEQWDCFNDAWQRILERFGVKVFHGLDFWRFWVEDGKYHRKQPYEGWSDADDLEFVDALISTIERTKLRKVGAGVDIGRFFELTTDERRWLTTAAIYDKDWGAKGKPDDPWYAAFQSTIISAASEIPETEKVCAIFDRRDSPDRNKQPEHTKARELYDEILRQQPRLKIRDKLANEIVFGSREVDVGLQAADFLSNRSRVYVAEGLGDDPEAERVRAFLEGGIGYVKFFGIRGLDLILRGCPFRSTFWKVDEFKTSMPDYLEQLRNDGVNVVAYKAVHSGHYYAHHIRAEKVTVLKRVGVSGNLVYIASPDSLIQPREDPVSGREK